MKEWYSAKELAGLPGMPGTERGINKKATKVGWKRQEVKSMGGPRGKRREYHLTALPDETRIHLVSLHAGSSSIIPDTEAARAGTELGERLRKEAEAIEQGRREAHERGLAMYKTLPESRRIEVDARFEILKARDAYIQSAGLPLKRGSEVFCQEVNLGRIPLADWIMDVITRQGRPSLSWTSLNRWKRAYDEQGVIGLASSYISRKGETSLAEEHQNLAIAMMVRYPGVNVSKVVGALKARFKDNGIPGQDAVRRFMKNWQEDNASVYLFLTNPDEWRNRHMFAFGQADENVTRLNEVWELDSTPGDVMLADGRHTLIGCIDIHSRDFQILVSPVSKATSIAALMRNCIINWGVPEKMRMDNGQDYVSLHIVRVLDSLGVEQALCRPFTPEAKPFIERAFRTFAHDIVELLPGYIGHNVAERKAIEARKSFADRLMKRGATVQVEMTAAELQVICDRWVTAVYRQNPHSGLDGKTPAEVARAWTGPVRKVSDPRALDILLSPAPKDGGFRTIQKKGVQVERQWFVAPEMAGFEGARVQVLFDATDMGNIYLFLENGQYLCTAVDLDFQGIDRAEFASRAKNLQKSIVRETTRELRGIAKRVAVENIHEEILQHRESRIANLAEFPRQPTEHITPALEEAVRAVADRERTVAPPVPIGITPEQEVLAAKAMARGEKRRLPATDYEKLEMLEEMKKNGEEISPEDEQWMEEYLEKILPIKNFQLK